MIAPKIKTKGNQQTVLYIRFIYLLLLKATIQKHCHMPLNKRIFILLTLFNGKTNVCKFFKIINHKVGFIDSRDTLAIYACVHKGIYIEKQRQLGFNYFLLKRDIDEVEIVPKVYLNKILYWF